MCVYMCVISVVIHSFIHLFIPFPGERLSWEALGCTVLWALLPAASGYWYLRDCPHQKRWKKKIAQKFCLLKLQKGTCSSTFCAVFCFTGFLTGEETKPSLWLPGRHYVLTAWSVASVAMYDQLMAFWTSALATQSVVQGSAEPLGSLRASKFISSTPNSLD